MIKTILFNCVFLCTVLQVTIACECGISPSVAKIYKGTPVTNHKYPWIAHVRIYSHRLLGSFAQCGGTLIDNQHIVTAAHCVLKTTTTPRRVIYEPYDPKAIDVYLGILKSDSKSNVPLKVSQVWFDSAYDREKLTNDLAILTLKEPVTFSPSIYPICLPNSEDNLSKLTVAGWGITNSTSSASTELLEVDVDYLPVSECEKIRIKYFREDAVIPEWLKPFFQLPPIAETAMCAINKETHGDACAGDSGGPLMYKGPTGIHYLVGAVSGSWAECATTLNAGGLYTRVHVYKDAISKMAPNACWKDLSI